MSDSILDYMRRAFDFLEDLGYRESDREYLPESFGNSFLEFRSRDLRLRIIRDRGEFALVFGSPGVRRAVERMQGDGATRQGPVPCPGCQSRGVQKTMRSNRVLLMVSDPWELGEAVNWQPLGGELLETTVDKHGGSALIRLDEALEHRGRTWRFVVASPRHENMTMDAIYSGIRVPSAFTGVSEIDAQSETWFDLEHWRGGLAFIGDLGLDERRS